MVEEGQGSSGDGGLGSSGVPSQAVSGARAEGGVDLWSASSEAQRSDCVINGFYHVFPTDWSGPPVAYAHRAEYARLIAAAPELLAFARAHEAWEALLIAKGRWEATGDGLPTLTEEIYDAMMELQAQRNRVIAKAALGTPTASPAEQ